MEHIQQFENLSAQIPAASKSYAMNSDILTKILKIGSVDADMVKYVRIYVKSNILQHLTLVDTPGYGDYTPFCTPLFPNLIIAEQEQRNIRVINTIRDVDGWIYLTVADQADKTLSNDISISPIFRFFFYCEYI